MNLAEIKELQSYYFEHRYSGKVAEQKEDDTFYRDEFTVPQLEDMVRISRTGDGARLVNRPVAQLASAVMKVSRKPIKDTLDQKDASLRISEMINEDWIPHMMRGNPNPKLAFIKYLFLRGEAYVQPLHSMAWVTRPFDKTGLPVYFRIPDPINIYPSPNENESGVPEHVCVLYERIPGLVKSLYPHWVNPENKKPNDTVTWWEYWDKSIRVFEADGQIVLESPNPYGKAPFVRKVSGWGTESPDGDPEDSVVGILRNSREILRRLCATASDKDWIMHNFANRSIDVQPIDDTHNVPKNFRDAYTVASGIVHELPYGITVTRAVEELPEIQYFQYENELRAQLAELTPASLSGGPVGGSGRQQDISVGIAMKNFEEQVRRTEDAFSTAFSMALEMCDKIPNLRPDVLNKSDLNGNYDIIVSLEAEDPIEQDRLRTLGSRLYQQGEIDLETNLTKYQGYTQEEAKRIMAKILVDNVTRNNPIIGELMGRRLAREAGMEEEYLALKGDMGMKENTMSPIPQTGINGGQPRVGNINDLMQSDIALRETGARRSPVA